MAMAAPRNIPGQFIFLASRIKIATPKVGPINKVVGLMRTANNIVANAANKRGRESGSIIIFAINRKNREEINIAGASVLMPVFTCICIGKKRIKVETARPYPRESGKIVRAKDQLRTMVKTTHIKETNRKIYTCVTISADSMAEERIDKAE